MKNTIVNLKFVERCNELKEERNLTLDEIEREIGIGKGIMSKYMSGKHIPNSEVIRKLSLVFNVTSDYLLGTSDARKDLPDLPKGYISIIRDAITAGITETELRDLIEMTKKLKGRS